MKILIKLRRFIIAILLCMAVSLGLKEMKVNPKSKKSYITYKIK